jgi:hypothetical protein
MVVTSKIPKYKSIILTWGYGDDVAEIFSIEEDGFHKNCAWEFI